MESKWFSTSVTSFTFHCISAFVIRLVMILYGRMQDASLDVKYTDIDYQVFSDAANHTFHGGSPFDRDTYRYTPVLAFLLLPNMIIGEDFGKLLFSVFDIATGCVIFYAINNHFKKVSNQMRVIVALLWLYNPVVLVVSTRGNAESIQAFFTIATLTLLMDGRWIWSALVYGFSIHFKIYPACYGYGMFLALGGLARMR